MPSQELAPSAPSVLPDREPLLSVKEVAARLGVSTQWVYDHLGGRSEPKLPYIPLGTVIKFKPSSIDAFIQAQENQPRRRKRRIQ